MSLIKRFKRYFIICLVFSLFVFPSNADSGNDLKEQAKQLEQEIIEKRQEERETAKQKNKETATKQKSKERSQKKEEEEEPKKTEIKKEAGKEKKKQANKELEEQKDKKQILEREEQLKNKKNKDYQYDNWKVLRSRPIDSSKKLSLSNLIDIALSNNPGTKEAWQDAQAALAQKKQAQSQLFPKVTASGGISKERLLSDVEAKDTDLIQYGPAFQLTYLLFDFGKRSASINQAAKLFSSQELLYNRTVQDLVLEVEKAYYNLSSTKAAKLAAEFDAKTAKEVLDAAKKRLDAGVTTKLDLLQASSDYNDALYEFEGTKANFANAKAALAQSLGLPADTEINILKPPSNISTDKIHKNVSKLIEEAIKTRPDVSSAYANLQAKKSAVDAAGASLFPDISLGGSAKKNWLDHKDYAPTTKNYEEEYTASISLSWDIFDGFYKLNKKRQAEAELEAASERFNQVLLEASVDVWTKFNKFKTALSRFKYSQAILKESKASYDLSLKSYKAGLKTILDLIQAQNQYSKARYKLIESRYDVFISLAEIGHATGTYQIKNKDKKLNHKRRQGK